LSATTQKSDLGVPATQDEAYALTLDDLISISGRVAAFVGAWDTDVMVESDAKKGAMVIDSALGLFVATLLTEEFAEDLIDFGKIEVWRWRSIGEVAAIVFDAVQAHRTVAIE
jgi:hypothetical protein